MTTPSRLRRDDVVRRRRDDVVRRRDDVVRRRDDDVRRRRTYIIGFSVTFLCKYLSVLHAVVIR